MLILNLALSSSNFRSSSSENRSALWFGELWPLIKQVGFSVSSILCFFSSS
jgi:hypothetical protein